MTNLNESSMRDDAGAEKKQGAVADYIPSGFENVAFFPDRTVDNLMQVVISLGAEHWMLRRRMFVLESVLQQTQSISAREIEEYVPTPEQQRAWEQERDSFIRRAYEALKSDSTGNGAAGAEGKRG